MEVLTYLLFVIGFGLLVKGGDWLVKGAVSIASRLKVSDLLIGLTIVSVGTSAPELIVNLIASFEGNAGLATGNVLGSNIANILLILGTTAIVKPLPIRRNTIIAEIPFSLAAALLVGFLANSALWYERADELHISRGDGMVILFFFFLFVNYILLIAREDRRKNKAKTKPEWPLTKSILFLSLGMAGLFLGGKWVVDGAIQLAGLMGMSQTFIGLTVVAVGTSLPELVTSIMAAKNDNVNLAIGNAVGSNIFNLLWILGISSVINPLPFNVASNVDILMVIGSSSMILLALIIGRKMEIKRYEGIVFLLVYLGYIFFLIVRG